MEVQKYKRPQQEVECLNNKCAKKFLKDCSEVKRNLRLVRNNYCSLECAGKVNGNVVGKGTTDQFKLMVRCDDFTGLREFLRRAKNRGWLYSITLQDLLDLWESQNGMCVYSGVNLVKPQNHKSNNLVYLASLDRIDSSKGYVVGNIQFVSAAANYAKNSMTHDNMLEFCKAVANHWNKSSLE